LQHLMPKWPQVKNGTSKVKMTPSLTLPPLITVRIVCMHIIPMVIMHAYEVQMCCIVCEVL